MDNLCFDEFPFLKELGLSKVNLGCYNGKEWCAEEKTINSIHPGNNKVVATIRLASETHYEQCLTNMKAIQPEWMKLSMVKRGLIVQEIGTALRQYKLALGSLVTLEMGKVLSEGLGEVQEAIDICDYAVGLSRTIAGKIYASERQDHMIYEMWNPLGLVGVITAFNFPCAVIVWNTAISMICGDLTIWKGASSTSLVSIACTKIMTDVIAKHGYGGVFTMVVGSGATVGERLINDKRLKMISFTGSTSVSINF